MAIDYSNFTEMFLIGASGSICVEILKCYERRNKLHYVKYKAVMKSPLFWISSILFILVAGVVTWVFNENNQNVTAMQLFATGMGAASIIRTVTQTAASSTRLTAGEDHDASPKDVFM